MLFEILMFLLVVNGSGINPTNDNIIRLLQTRRIGHGMPASLGEFRYQVAIKTPKHFADTTTFTTFCGGTIIKLNVVLSAAHCFVPEHYLGGGRIYQKAFKNEFVVAGNINNKAKYSLDYSDIDGQWRRIQDIRFPVTYDFPKDDLAILHLRKPFIYDPFVSPIAYATIHRDYAGFNCVATGYGVIENMEQSEVLRKATLEVLPIDTCNKLFEFPTEKMVCTTDQVSDVLEGDSGGPLVCNDASEGSFQIEPVLVGIVSGGYTGVGSVFTRVSSYKQFIARGKASSLKNNAIFITWITFQMLIL